MADPTANTKEIGIRESYRILLTASRGFWCVNIVNFGDGIAYFGILVLLTRFLGTRLGMSDQATGVTVSFYTGLVTLFMFGGGFISDRLGVRRALTWSLLVIGIGRVLLSGAVVTGTGGLAHGTAWLGLFLMALGTGVLQPALYAGIKEYTDPRTATIGYSLLYAIMNLGIVAEHFVSPFIRSDEVFLNLGFAEIVGLGWGIDGVFWMCVFITALLLLVNITFFTAKVEARRQVTQAEESAANTPTSMKEKLKELPFLDKRFIFFIFILLPVRTLFAHQFLTMPDYVFRAYPESVSAKFEWINGLNPFIIVVFVPLIATLTRRVRVIDMMIVGTILSAATTFVLVPGPSLSVLLIYVILFSLGEAIWSSRFLEYVAKLAPAGKVGAYMGLAGIPWFLAKFTTGLYSGSLLERYVPVSGPQDTTTLWLIYALIACVSPAGLIMARRWLLGSAAVDSR
jgi:POT family proton-dependent oligopeptide transporter